MIAHKGTNMYEKATGRLNAVAKVSGAISVALIGLANVVANFQADSSTTYISPWDQFFSFMSWPVEPLRCSNFFVIWAFMEIASETFAVCLRCAHWVANFHFFFCAFWYISPWDQ